jgi:hypothetical protein
MWKVILKEKVMISFQQYNYQTRLLIFQQEKMLE